MNRFGPLLLIAAGIAGCICGAIHHSGLAFACWSVLGAIGVQEMLTTERHESGEPGGF